ncbi:MAG: tRNA glutamyl-Q(34) synthetase GluQRS [Propionibacteriaceae bacterium]|nr:tRNA glutamyl-Q(34) synthetase GluQRS [Propionibacteriaceae bacterium]
MAERTAGAGRFAPSPTSDLHVGNLRTALLAWVMARASGRGFLVRIEDLDQQRVGAAPATATRQLDDLAAIGLDWDEPPVRQTERLDLYRDAIARLDTYECFCTRREIAQAAQAPHADYRPYPGTCAHLTDDQRAAKRASGRPPALRVRADGASFTICDRHAGALTRVVDDFVLRRGDGTPAYNLACVLDDGLQGIDQVVRGADLLDSAPRQAWLATRLGFPAPDYGHVGMAVTTAGVRLAKRDGAVTLRDLGERGRTPADVVRRLCASLGWPLAATAPEALQLVRDDPGLLDATGVWAPWVVDPATL